MATRSKKSPRAPVAPSEPIDIPLDHVDGLTPGRMPADVPVIYADQISDIIFGIHTSKLVLSLENGRGPVRPVAMVIVPTASLVVSSGNFLDVMSSDAMIAETSQRFAGVVETLRRLNELANRRK